MNGERSDRGMTVVPNQHPLQRLRQITTPLVRAVVGQAKTQTRHLLNINQKRHHDGQLEWLPYKGEQFPIFLFDRRHPVVFNELRINRPVIGCGQTQKYIWFYIRILMVTCCGPSDRHLAFLHKT
jgi:hypothetical protein